LVPALRLSHAPVRHDADEAGFTLDLRNLVVPDGPGCLVRPGPEDLPLLTAWRAAYLADLFATPAKEAREQAARDVAAWLVADSHRMLVRDGAPVAICGFNAQLPDVVQIGGVYVPPEHRSSGCAREAVARHLVEARANGVRRAVLFSVSAMATRAYRAIGFRPGESMAIVLFDGAQEVPA
jgi:predicted GNAT family acetyltransferase